MSSKKKQMSLGVILSYLLIGVKLLTGILYTPIVLKSLGQSQYGVYSLCISFIGYLTILNAGVNAAYIRFYVQEKTVNESGVKKLNGVFAKIFIVLSVIELVGGLLIAQFSPYLFGSKITAAEYDLVRKCFYLLAVTVAIEILTCLFKSFITANEQFIFGKTVDIITSILAPILTVPFLLRGYDCTSIIAVRLGVDGIAIVLDFIFCRKKLKIAFKFGESDKALLRNIRQFIEFIALQSIMDQLNWQIDKFILAWTQGTSEISIYSVGGTFNTYFLQIGGAVSGVFIAEINRIAVMNDDVRLNRLFRRTCKLFTYIIGFFITAFFVFGHPFILRWAGEDYGRSFTVGWMLMSPVTFSIIMGLGQDIARAKNKHQMQIVINICICIANMIVSIPLAKYFGAVGSAFGTFVTEIIMCIVIQPLYYNKVLGIDVKNVFLDVCRYLPGLIIPAAFGLFINRYGLLRANYRSILLYAIIFSVLYLFSVFAFSMRSEDRAYVLKYLRRS